MQVEKRMRKPASKLSDVELFERIVADDREAFAMLYDRHSDRLFGLAVKLLNDRELAADALQDVFLQAWNQRSRYSRRRGEPLIWLSVICRNRCIDMMRSRASTAKRTVALAEATLPVEPEDSAGPLVETQIAQLKEVVATAFNRLPDNQLAVVRLAFEGGLSHSEIATELDVPLGTVKSRIRLGLDKLKEALTGFND